MVRLVLAEKPDQAKKYAQALGKAEKKSGVWVIKNPELAELTDEIHVVSASGHILEYDNPYKKFENWELANLPAFPENFTLILKEGRSESETKKIKFLFDTIKREVGKADDIIIGTDADREGERIAYTILSQIPGALDKVTSRLWVNSQTKAGILKAFKELRKAEETVNFYHEAEARSVSDWLVGFNLSPLTTLTMQQRKLLAFSKKSRKLSVGRVQTPMVALIVKNHEAIEHFQSAPFWKLQLALPSDPPLFLTNDQKYLEQFAATQALNRLSTEATVQSVDKTVEAKQAPNLFTLTKLQSYGAKKWKKSSKEVLGLVESLYLKGYLSYPRTDCPYITQFEFEYLKQGVLAYQEVLSTQMVMTQLEPRKKYVNDAKVQEHYAIVPTEVVPDLTQLSADERLVYETVTKRTLLMFTADYQYERTTVVVDNQGVEFSMKGTTLIDLGYRAYMDVGSKESLLPPVEVGQRLSVTPQLKEDKTKPPARITEGSLLDKLLPKYSLGTSATRAGIIEAIQQKDYVKKNKKTGEFTPTERGIKMIHYLTSHQNLFADPKTTADWENALKHVGTGELAPSVFIEETKKEIARQVAAVKAQMPTT